MSPKNEIATLADMRSKALTDWRSAARQIADGGSPPSVIEVLEWGVLLGIEGPMEELERDAAAILEADELEDRAAAVKARLEQPIRDAGGTAAIRDRIAELKSEARRLEGLIDGNHFTPWSYTLRELSDIRRRHPRVLGQEGAAA